MKTNSGSSIKIQFFISILVPVLILSMVSTLSTTYIINRNVQERISSEILQEIEEIQLLASGGIDPKTGETLISARSLLENYISKSVPDLNEVKFAFVEDQVVARSTNLKNDNLHNDELFISQVLSSPFGFIATASSTEGDITFGKVEVLSKETKALFVIAINAEAESATTDTARNALLSIQLIALFLALSLGFFVTRRVTRPLTELVEAAESISPGQTDKRIQIENQNHLIEVKTLQDSMNKMLIRLEKYEVEQRRFIDDAGHELRTPLTVINGNLDLLSQDYPDLDRLKTIKSEVSRMSRLVRDLQSLTHASKSNYLKISETDYQIYLDELKEKCSQLGNRKFEFSVSGSGNMKIDSERLTQAILQIVENALKFSPESTAIEIDSELSSDELRINIKDHGVGISDADKERIFDRFYQATQTHNSKNPGAGLGLSIVKQIVSGHGGEIKVDSQPNHGTTFKITIPLSKES